jgi:branched-chain amino acid transport system ATP-binding protein
MMLELKDICSYYGDSFILQGVSMGVEQKEIVTLLGRNGVGKTTTLKNIMGLVSPRRGDIIFQGKKISDQPAFIVARMGMSYVPQGRLIVPNLSVLENLEIAKNQKEGGRFDLKRIFSYFPKLEVLKNSKGGHLSGGEQQMLAIARALLRDPTMILIDEPSEGLAPLIVRALGEMIVDFKKEGITILLVEQNVEMALKIADRCYIMSKGKIEYQGTAKEIRASEEIKSKYLAV